MIKTFADRHIGPTAADAVEMAGSLGYESLEAVIDAAVPAGIRQTQPLDFEDFPEALNEPAALDHLRAILSENTVQRSLLGQGYYGTHTPPVIQRNILENPGWYTAYTPYQAEIAQGRLEALLNFQTMVADLTGMPVANASLLDEATAAAEAMTMAAGAKPKATRFFVSERCHPQTIAVLQTRAEPVGIDLVIGDETAFAFDESAIGVLLQYPCTEGSIRDYSAIATAASETRTTVVVASDLLALTLLKPPGEWGADIVVGSAQRFGVPLGYGGPHAAFMACSDKMKRRLPGRLVGVSHDADGRPALRLALQTREQHIRREKATSNICTAQVLLAVMAGMYAVYHGPEGLKAIAQKIHHQTRTLADRLCADGFKLSHEAFFDTIVVDRAPNTDVNFRHFPDGRVGISLDETTTSELLDELAPALEALSADSIPEPLQRTSDFLTHPIFHRYHTETEMLRYLRRLEGKDIALNWSMIPLGSCTMKLNATAEMMPVTWNEVGGLHPFAPAEQATGYATMASLLEQWLCDITGFAAVSLQPNAGSQGEFAGLLAIRRYHLSRGDTDRTICLIPTSAHGTNPASAVMAGMQVVPVKCDDAGNIDVADIRAKAAEHADHLAALMITYPSTHGVFEETVTEICDVIHQHGGQVYLDGANLNAMVGIARPGDIGGDVCHMNLHKTFCIPHGGGGPGVGPIGVAAHLAPFLPDETAPVSAADLGSASILTISWMYIAMMAGDGLTLASKTAILSANYIAKRLDPYFPVLYKGKNNLVAHECIIDLRPLKETTGVEVEDVAKRLIDYGFHAPTMSWPVAGTLMIEPTESESRAELDRFCDAMIRIHAEIHSNLDLLKNAPHPAESLLSEKWDRTYTPAAAAYPAPWTREAKYWPPVSRIDNVYGDRNLVCSCEGMESYGEA